MSAKEEIHICLYQSKVLHKVLKSLVLKGGKESMGSKGLSNTAVFSTSAEAGDMMKGAHLNLLSKYGCGSHNEVNFL